MRLTSVKDYEKVFSGGEPTWKNGETSITKALNWYNYHSDAKESKKYTLQYLKETKVSKQDIDLLEKIPEEKFDNLGFVCRIKMRGGPLTETNISWISSRIKELKAVAQIAVKPKADNKNVISIQDRIADKSKEIIDLS